MLHRCISLHRVWGEALSSISWYWYKAYEPPFGRESVFVHLNTTIQAARSNIVSNLQCVDLFWFLFVYFSLVRGPSFTHIATDPQSEIVATITTTTLDELFILVFRVSRLGLSVGSSATLLLLLL